MVYQENQTDPITEVEYRYQQTPYLTNSARLSNEATVIYPDGSTGTASIGVFFDMVADMRESRSEIYGLSIMANLDAFFVGPLPPIPVPVILPSTTHEVTQFRSATTTKIIQRFGILEETIARDLKSVVSTKNLAYDAETGEVLLTQTKTNFNDDIYSLTYPSHWYYDGMGQAYRNIAYSKNNVSFSTGGVATITNADQYFTEGDEISLSNGSGVIKGWVVNVNNSTITAVKKEGWAVNGTYNVKVIRSGRRNMQAIPIASVTSLSNPLSSFSTNVFANVLQASAMEFGDKWNTWCDCFNESIPFTTNPYVLGTKGNWRMIKSHLHLSPRTQSAYNNNTNIRKDGVFTSYTPFYKRYGGDWAIDDKNWTFTSEVTEFSPFGQELENRDALGRYSAATFGYYQTLATSVAANAKYKEIGSDNFEDHDFSDCADNHFKITGGTINTSNSHTGRKSVKVTTGNPVSLTKQLTEACAPETCGLEVSTNKVSNTTTVSIDAGLAPYAISWDIVSGSPTISLTDDEIAITGTGFTIQVTIMDANGCKEVLTVKHN